jgi:hypothetical protein
MGVKYLRTPQITSILPEFETCIYKKIFLYYTYGAGKIYTTEEIDKARASPSKGNIF